MMGTSLSPNPMTLPTVYEYYTSGGISSGLNADQSTFTLNGKNITLYSGAMHYFRTPKKLWRDRLRKMRAAGLNAVETYVPWNLHEPSPGQFDFGQGGTDMEDFLDIETFLKTAKEEDLLAILRPGPYICAEWEFGGFPSWLLREKDIKFRTSDSKYMGPVKRFLNALLPILTALQFINGGPILSFQIENEYGSTESDTFETDKEYLKELRQIYLDNNITALLTSADGVAFATQGSLPEYFLITANFGCKFGTSLFLNTLLPILASLQFLNGGPIIAFQVENEYGSTKSKYFTPDKTYLQQLRQIYLNNNITELLATADGVTIFGSAGTLMKYFLVTANFNSNPNSSFDALQLLQPNRPKMAMEYYPGWFDHWGEEHHTTLALELILNLQTILKYPGSFNIYMFHGGTSYGFMNGANLAGQSTDNSEYQPDTTSYDYDAPLTEAGDYTTKYELVKQLLAKYASPQTRLPDKPALTVRLAYEKVSVVKHIPLATLIDSQTTKLVYEKPTAMELLDINNGNGQSYGYIVYRKDNVDLSAGATLTIQGHVCDSVLVHVNGQLISPPLKTKDGLNKFGFYRQADSQLTLTDTALTGATIDLVVENWGRVNYGKLPQYYQFKGLWQGDILIDGNVITDWQHIPLEFKKVWNLGLQGWTDAQSLTEPGLYKAYINIETPQDTYVDLRQWTKGIVIINGFVLGRYARIGPQQCLYLPAVFLKQGQNEIVIFEHYNASDEVVFSTDQIWESV